jgi:two-component system, response regulator PdtaR
MTRMQQSTVLVVEDDPMLRVDAALMFEEAGFEVSEFESAEEALAFVWDRADEIAAIFTDVQILGETSGFDLAAIVTASWPHIELLITSGRVGEAPDTLPTRVRFFPKPWSPNQVLAALRPTVRLH